MATAPISDKFYQARARQIHGKVEGQADYIMRIAGDLNQIAEENVAKLPEDIFREVFLPLLAGDATLKHKAGIADWISIAGTPYKEVDVFDPATKAVLFRCPPLFDYNGVNPVRDPSNRGQRPVADIVAMADKLTNLHPNQGIAFLTTELGKRALTMNSSSRLAPNVKRWTEVFQRYNRNPLGEVNTAAVAATPEHLVQGPGPDAEYEDF
jgi:hypothetical protein